MCKSYINTLKWFLTTCGPWENLIIPSVTDVERILVMWSETDALSSSGSVKWANDWNEKKGFSNVFGTFLQFSLLRIYWKTCSGCRKIHSKKTIELFTQLISFAILFIFSLWNFNSLSRLQHIKEDKEELPQIFVERKGESRILRLKLKVSIHIFRNGYLVALLIDKL